MTDSSDNVAGASWWVGMKPAKVGVNVLNLGMAGGTKSMKLGSFKITEEGLQWRGNLGRPKLVMPWSEIVDVVVEGETRRRVSVGRVATMGVFALAAKKTRRDSHLTVVTTLAEHAFLFEKIVPEVLRTKLRPVLDALASVPANPADAVDPVEQIRKLGELRDQGLVTEAEFEAKKAEMLGRM